MNEKLLKNLDELSTSIQENSVHVEKELSNGKSIPNRAMVISAAKYRKALELLGNE